MPPPLTGAALVSLLAPSTAFPSKTGAQRIPVQRLLKPRSPDDCSACRLASTPSTAVRPASAEVSPLALGLEATSMWEQHGESLWLRDEYLPPKLEKENPRLPSQPPALTPAQQERAIILIRQGLSLRKVADLLETSYESIRRFVKSQGIRLATQRSKAGTR